MYAYQSAFIKTCRILANRTRLQLLWQVFLEKKLNVENLAAIAGISPQNGSTQLSLLATQGFIEKTRKQRTVIYRLSTDPGSEAKHLLPPLIQAQLNKTPFEHIIHQTTAFTHDRRVQIARCLSISGKTFESLLNKTGMTEPALTRHLRKLKNRDIIVRTNGQFSLKKSNDYLARCLLELAIR